MSKYLVKGYYTITQYVDRVVKADTPEEAEEKAKAYDFVKETKTEQEEDTEFVVSEEPSELDDHE